MSRAPVTAYLSSSGNRKAQQPPPGGQRGRRRCAVNTAMYFTTPCPLRSRTTLHGLSLSVGVDCAAGRTRAWSGRGRGHGSDASYAPFPTLLSAPTSRRYCGCAHRNALATIERRGGACGHFAPLIDVMPSSADRYPSSSTSIAIESAQHRNSVSAPCAASRSRPPYACARHRMR